MRGVYGGLLACLLLAGCAVRQGNLEMFDNQIPASTDQRAAIAAYIRNNFFDPYSIRDAEISSAVESVGSLDGSTKNPPMICVIDNAKNRMGGYTGKRATLYYLTYSGQIGRAVDSADDTFVNPFCEDSRLRYVPFPEIEQQSGRSVSAD
jgi:hypothetical protein